MFIRRNKLGIVGEILDFFAMYTSIDVHGSEIKSLEDCDKYLQEKGIEIQLRRLLSIVKKFEHEGFLLKIGQKGSDPVYGSTYLAHNIYSDYLEYGSYDFFYHGFSSIRNHFLHSILPIDVTKEDDSKDIGTCFVIDAHRLLTARHCIEAKKNIVILDSHNQFIKPSSIWVPSDDKDIALIEMGYYNYSSVPQFKIGHGDVLEEILTMGYPPIPGFEAINISDIAHLSAAIKVSEGKIIGEERTLFDNDSCFLINAKVKGGNSGGPIINNLGFAIGMIISIPLDAEDQQKIDYLAYGIAVTGKELNNFLAHVGNQNEKVKKLPLKINPNGFTTLQ